MKEWLPPLAAVVGGTVGCIGGFLVAAAFSLDDLAFFAAMAGPALLLGFAAASMVKRRLTP
ncbi:hypothetical protein [Cellulomonas xylanilytica]|uniref:Uncharacterized protein n=1 Tax=Cellulomonas xylanilytica TaxID=233583 RepID=A0A510V892_9CELL|nr:hypothetical protein [Cellulomonas xylanilytica]GEK23082.1 hypothetical protein CXY01_36020 [Cellulomonas xylanilytica]